MNAPAYELVFIVDRSGSMAGVAADMSKGLNDLVAKQRELPGECRVTLAQFDHEHEVVHDALPITDVPPYTLRPRGSTALLDAIGRTLTMVGERIDKIEGVKPNVIVTIITDGAENSSKEWDRQRIFDLISTRRSLSNWEVAFLGADQDAIAAAAPLGIDAGRAVSYANSGLGNNAVMHVLNCSIAETRTSGGSVLSGAGGQSMQTAYNVAMKAEAPAPKAPVETTSLGGIVILDSSTAASDANAQQ